MAKTEWRKCSEHCAGYGVFDAGGTGLCFEIEKCDQCDRFDTDVEAVEYVIDSAMHGEVEGLEALAELARAPHLDVGRRGLIENQDRKF